jgi:hypothetical protein
VFALGPVDVRQGKCKLPGGREDELQIDVKKWRTAALAHKHFRRALENGTRLDS